MWKQNERMLTLSTADITCDNVNNPRMEEEVLCEHSSYQGSMGVGPSGLFLHHISKKSLIQQIYRILIVCRGSCLILNLSPWIIHRRGSGCSQQRKVTNHETCWYANPCCSGDNEDTVSSWVKKPTQESSWQQSTTKPTSSWVKPTTKPVSLWESPTPKLPSQWEVQPTEKPRWTKSTATPSSKWGADWVQPYSPVPKAWQKRELDSGKSSF